MERNQPQLAVFKYQHDGRVGLSHKRKIFVIAALVLAVIASLAFFPGGVFAFLLPLFAYAGRPRTLSIGPRYLVCGDDIVYYANVTQLRLAEAQGRMDLVTTGGKVFSIERAKFPTNARKTAKIAVNKAAKFNKVTAKIVDKVRRVAPAAVVA